ncbi:hypothetical protein WAF17_02505 [Bernardetia sp. ABR2-2B]|uniref:hypothetical protein n=1 Tax=Bernardetia sp. ABR2-2B TaxID=3127472 RepID=UPI0030CF4891
MILEILQIKTVTLGALLDFGQTSGLFTLTGFMFRQFLAFRDMKRDVADLKEAKNKAEQEAKELADKNEEKELQREAVYQQILEEVREVKVEFREVKVEFRLLKGQKNETTTPQKTDS